MFFLSAILFFILTPGILLNIPGKNKLVTALCHAILFAIIYSIIVKYYYKRSEGFAGTNSPPSGPFSKSCKGYTIGNGSINGGTCTNSKGESVNNSSFLYANCPLLSVTNNNGNLQCGA